jgi:hypothetical protein
MPLFGPNFGGESEFGSADFSFEPINKIKFKGSKVEEEMGQLSLMQYLSSLEPGEALALGYIGDAHPITRLQ